MPHLFNTHYVLYWNFIIVNLLDIHVLHLVCAIHFGNHN